MPNILLRSYSWHQGEQQLAVVLHIAVGGEEEEHVKDSKMLHLPYLLQAAGLFSTGYFIFDIRHTFLHLNYIFKP